MEFINPEFIKMIESVRMDLYADSISFDRFDCTHLELIVSDESDTDYRLRVSLLDIQPLDKTQSINHIVDAFRHKFARLGV